MFKTEKKMHSKLKYIKVKEKAQNAYAGVLYIAPIISLKMSYKNKYNVSYVNSSTQQAICTSCLHAY